MEGVPIPHMEWESQNLPEAWRRFKQHVELVFAGPFQKRKEKEKKCAYLMLWIGEKGRDIRNTWTITDAEAKLLATYYTHFEAYVSPKANPIFARYKFNEKLQDASESFDQFVTELKLLVKDCGYTNADEMVQDRIVFGVHSPKVREKLLSHGAELTLDKAIDIARSYELTLAQMKCMVASNSAREQQTVHAVNKERYQATTSKRAESFPVVLEMKLSDTQDTIIICGVRIRCAKNVFPFRSSGNGRIRHLRGSWKERVWCGNPRVC